MVKRIAPNFKVFHLICPCYRKSKLERQLFNIGKDKFTESMDLVTLIDRIRETKLISYLLLNKYQREFMKYFTENLITFKKQSKASRSPLLKGRTKALFIEDDPTRKDKFFNLGL